MANELLRKLDQFPESTEPAVYPGEDADEGDYASYSRALWDDQDHLLFPLHQSWVQNLLFLTNRQWWQVDKLSGNFTLPKVPEWKERPQSNISLAYYKTFLAKATKNRPAVQAVPASGDPDDLNAAELAEEVLEAKWRELNLARQLRKAIAWTIATGNAYIYPFWNTDTGKVVPLTVPVDLPDGTTVDAIIDANGEPVLLEDGTPDPTAEPIYMAEGDVGVKVYSPFQIRVNADAEYEEDVEWVIIAESRPVQDVRNQYPDKAWEINADDTRIDEYDRLMNSLMSGPDTQMVGTMNPDTADKALVLHYHEKPSPQFPQGRYWVSCNNSTILVEPTELPEGLWPCIIHMTDVDVPGRYHAMPTLEAIIGINREYNELNAQIKEHHNMHSRGKWLVPKGSGIKKGTITNRPGEVIQYNPGFEPKQADLKSLPAAVYNERERLLSDFEQVSGVHKISMGAPPPGVTAGVAFLQLQEADDTDFGPFLQMLEESVAMLSGMILQIIKDNYEEERLIAVSGPNKRYIVKSFIGSDLQGVHDIVPVYGSSAPWGQVAKQNLLMQLATQIPEMFQDKESGMFDAAKLARLLPLGGLESVSANEDEDIAEARTEQMMFEEYIPGSPLPMVEFYQNHMVHYKEHVRLLKSAKFKQWDEESAMLFKQHVMEHQMAIQQAMMPAQQPQAGAQPGGEAPDIQQATDDAMGVPEAPMPTDLDAMNPNEQALQGLDGGNMLPGGTGDTGMF